MTIAPSVVMADSLPEPSPNKTIKVGTKVTSTTAGRSPSLSTRRKNLVFDVIKADENGNQQYRLRYQKGLGNLTAVVGEGKVAAAQLTVKSGSSDNGGVEEVEGVETQSRNLWTHHREAKVNPKQAEPSVLRMRQQLISQRSISGAAQK